MKTEYENMKFFKYSDAHPDEESDWDGYFKDLPPELQYEPIVGIQPPNKNYNYVTMYILEETVDFTIQDLQDIIDFMKQLEPNDASRRKQD